MPFFLTLLPGENLSSGLLSLTSAKCMAGTNPLMRGVKLIMAPCSSKLATSPVSVCPAFISYVFFWGGGGKQNKKVASDGDEPKADRRKSNQSPKTLLEAAAPPRTHPVVDKFGAQQRRRGGENGKAIRSVIARHARLETAAQWVVFGLEPIFPVVRQGGCWNQAVGAAGQLNQHARRQVEAPHDALVNHCATDSQRRQLILAVQLQLITSGGQQHQLVGRINKKDLRQHLW